jgi:pimeloyl-ACP methyl ester carboxylesterase
METVSSNDGTKIAYDEQGQGPALILVNGAMNTRSSGSSPELASLLTRHLTVYSFDRRGRGESGDTLPYAVAREIEDVEALISVAGGTASLYGHSSGASLALEAAVALGERVKRLAMYEAPYNDDPEAKRAWREYIEQLTDALAGGRRGDAVALFMSYVRVPAAQIAGMRQAPFWSDLEALAPTLAYDHTCLLGSDAAIPVERAARIRASTLVMHGGASFAFMGETARTLSHAIPHAQLRTLEGQTHEVDPAVLAPALIDFFSQD